MNFILPYQIWGSINNNISNNLKKLNENIPRFFSLQSGLNIYFLYILGLIGFKR